MRFSRKIENYITTEDIEQAYQRTRLFSDGRNNTLDILWDRIMKKYPYNSDKWDDLYDFLKHQLYNKYEIDAEVKVTIRERDVQD